jgi:dimethylhistidine N-methyltransferase
MAVLRTPTAARPDPGPVADGMNGCPPADPAFLADALAGLSATPKTLPCKYFYDRFGSELFDRICELPEYYPTRTELGILRRHAGDMAGRLGSGCLVVEYGSGSSLKTPLLLEQLVEPAGYVPVDVACDHLLDAAGRIAGRFPGLAVRPVCADFTGSFAVPAVLRPVRRRVVYFPGSTVGNFDPVGARALLAGIARLCGPGGGLLIGVDLRKNVAVLEAAYDDAAGVTAAFNRNLLDRLANELGADLDPSAFRHRAFYNATEGRIEMHLESTRAQTIRLAGREFRFAAGETIHTENSYKYDLAGFAALAASAGLRVEDVWMDDRRLFSVQYLSVA